MLHIHYCMFSPLHMQCFKLKTVQEGSLQSIQMLQKIGTVTVDS